MYIQASEMYIHLRIVSHENVYTSVSWGKLASPIGIIGIATVIDTTQKSLRPGAVPAPRHRLKYARERPPDGLRADMRHVYRGAAVRPLVGIFRRFAWSGVPMAAIDRYYNRWSERCDLALTRSLPPICPIVRSTVRSVSRRPKFAGVRVIHYRAPEVNPLRENVAQLTLSR